MSTFKVGRSHGPNSYLAKRIAGLGLIATLVGAPACEIEENSHTHDDAGTVVPDGGTNQTPDGGIPPSDGGTDGGTPTSDITPVYVGCRSDAQRYFTTFIKVGLDPEDGETLNAERNNNYRGNISDGIRGQFKEYIGENVYNSLRAYGISDLQYVSPEHAWSAFQGFSDEMALWASPDQAPVLFWGITNPKVTSADAFDPRYVAASISGVPYPYVNASDGSAGVWSALITGYQNALSCQRKASDDLTRVLSDVDALTRTIDEFRDKGFDERIVEEFRDYRIIKLMARAALSDQSNIHFHYGMGMLVDANGYVNSDASKLPTTKEAYQQYLDDMYSMGAALRNAAPSTNLGNHANLYLVVDDLAHKASSGDQPTTWAPNAQQLKVMKAYLGAIERRAPELTPFARPDAPAPAIQWRAPILAQ